MLPLGIIDRLLGIGRIIGQVADERAKDWGRFVRDEPRAAANTLDRIAVELEARHASLNPRRRFLRRRIGARARAYRAEAARIRREHCG